MDGRSRLDRYQNLRNGINNNNNLENTTTNSFTRPAQRPVSNFNANKYQTSEYDALLQEHEAFLKSLENDQTSAFNTNFASHSSYQTETSTFNRPQSIQNQTYRKPVETENNYSQPANQTPVKEVKSVIQPTQEFDYRSPVQEYYYQTPVVEVKIADSQPKVEIPTIKPVEPQSYSMNYSYDYNNVTKVEPAQKVEPVKPFQPFNIQTTYTYQQPQSEIKPVEAKPVETVKPVEPVNYGIEGNNFDYSAFAYSNDVKIAPVAPTPQVEVKPAEEAFVEPAEEIYVEPIQEETYVQPIEEQAIVESVEETVVEPVEEVHAEPIQEEINETEEEVYIQPLEEHTVTIEEEPAEISDIASLVENQEEVITDKTQTFDFDGYIDSILQQFDNDNKPQQETVDETQPEEKPFFEIEEDEQETVEETTVDDITAAISQMDLKNFDFADETEIKPVQQVETEVKIEPSNTGEQPIYYDDPINVNELTTSLEKEKIRNEELLEMTKQLDFKVSEYENELNDVNASMNKTNKILNFVLTLLILALFVILFVIAFWFAQDRGLI